MSKRDFIIALDVDGPVADLFSTWAKLHNNLNPDREPYTVEAIYSPRAVHDAVLLDILSADDLYDQVQPVTGALEGIAALKSIGRVVYATSCVQKMTDAKWRWLQRYNLLPQGTRQADDLIVTHDKSLVSADILIDDHGKNLDRFHGYGILFDAPWNQHDFVSGGVRVKGWYETTEMVRYFYSTKGHEVTYGRR